MRDLEITSEVSEVYITSADDDSALLLSRMTLILELEGIANLDSSSSISDFDVWILVDVEGAWNKQYCLLSPRASWGHPYAAVVSGDTILPPTFLAGYYSNSYGPLTTRTTSLLSEEYAGQKITGVKIRLVNYDTGDSVAEKGVFTGRVRVYGNTYSKPSPTITS